MATLKSSKQRIRAMVWDFSLYRHLFTGEMQERKFAFLEKYLSNDWITYGVIGQEYRLSSETVRENIRQVVAIIDNYIYTP